MGEKIEIDKDELSDLIRSIVAESKEVADDAKDGLEEVADEGKKTLADMTPKEVEAFFAAAVKNAMGELDKKKTPDAKPVKPKPPRPRDDDDETPTPTRTRHDEKREESPSEPPKKKRFSMWGDD